MFLSSFCCVLSLQVGASVLASVFITLASVIFIANIFYFTDGSEETSKNASSDESEEGGWPTETLLIIIVFIILLIVVGILAFFSSLNESRIAALLALLLIVILLVFWLVLCIYSFYNDPDSNVNVCVATHCPETFWLANLDYKRSRNGLSNKTSLKVDKIKKFPVKDKEDLYEQRNELFQQYETTFDTPFNMFSSVKDNFSDNIMERYYVLHKTEIDKDFKTNFKKSQNLFPNNDIQRYSELYFLSNKTNKNEKKDKKSRYKHGFHFIAAILLFFINLIFLVYSALVMWSWADELKWADYYIEDETIWYY
ncbi:hypothetical protein J6590_063964 [Homalodisca vitripennis]|nr:hypothetical protein J6590_063964 [Homalodisca vitripennis]